MVPWAPIEHAGMIAKLKSACEILMSPGDIKIKGYHPRTYVLAVRGN